MDTKYAIKIMIKNNQIEIIQNIMKSVIYLFRNLSNIMSR